MNGHGPGLTKIMIDRLIIKHPLDECVNAGNLSDLDLPGRISLDLIMTMICDLRFCIGRIEGTCARYFLLVDLSVLHSLCASANLNCDKVRHYIQQFDCVEPDEPKAIAAIKQASFQFLNNEGSETNDQDLPREAQLELESDLGQLGPFEKGGERGKDFGNDS